jgi:hypothetical protein
MYMYICVHECVHICVQVHVLVCVHVSAHVCEHVLEHVGIHVHICTCTCTCLSTWTCKINVYVLVHIHVHVCVNVHVHVCVHVHAHVCVHVLVIYFVLGETLNPFSHYIFCVSCLTASCHMRHPYKADLGKKWRQLWCLCVHPSAQTSPAKWFKTEWQRQIFTFFALTSPVGLRFEFWKDWQNPQSMLIPNLFVFIEFSLLKASKTVKTTAGPVCVCERQPFLPVRQSPENFLGLLK